MKKLHKIYSLALKELSRSCFICCALDRLEENDIIDAEERQAATEYLKKNRTTATKSFKATGGFAWWDIGDPNRIKFLKHLIKTCKAEKI